MRQSARTFQHALIVNDRAAGNDQAPKGYPVSLGNDMPGAAYLVEYRYFPDEASELRAMTARELVDFLSSNIEHAHYTGDECTVVGMWRWDGPGKLTALDMESRGCTTDNNDYMHSRYVLVEKDGASADKGQEFELEFVVTLDGRA